MANLVWYIYISLEECGGGGIYGKMKIIGTLRGTPFMSISTVWHVRLFVGLILYYMLQKNRVIL
jgi:hypothetical protein